MSRGRGFGVLDESFDTDDGDNEQRLDQPVGGDAVRRAHGLLPIVAALLGLIVAIYGLGTWWRAAHDERARQAAVRDTVLIAATQDIETMNSLDYRRIDQGLARWRAVTTGTLHDQLAQVGADDRTLLAQQHKVSTGKVIKAAVVDLGDGTATVIASVEVTVRDGNDLASGPTIKRNRFTADLVHTGGTWKLESLDQVAVSMQ